MDLALVLSGLLMGLAGSPHCAAMCGAGCAAVCGPGRGSRLWSFQVARLLSYSIAGAVVASSVGALASIGQAVAALRPLWTLLHVAAAALGLWLLWTGRQPAWLERVGRTREARPSQPARPMTWVARPGKEVAMLAAGAGGQSMSAAAPVVAGLSWVAWPCGLLQSALVVAGLANGAGSGALVMAVFAASSSLGLIAGPWLWARLGGGRGSVATWSVRLAGAALLGASSWALGHGLWMRVAAWCGF